MMLVFLLTNRAVISFVIFSIFFDVILTVNHYKIYFRDEPLKPADFILGKEMAGIMENYQLPFSLKIAVLTLALILIAVILLK